MWMKVNAKPCGALDDIVIYRQKYSEQFMYAIQSKHGLHRKLIQPNAILQPRTSNPSLTLEETKEAILKDQSNSNFKYPELSLLKYAHTYKSMIGQSDEISKMLNEVRQKNGLTCILYTNHGVKFLDPINFKLAKNKNKTKCKVANEETNGNQSKNKKNSTGENKTSVKVKEPRFCDFLEFEQSHHVLDFLKTNNDHARIYKICFEKLEHYHFFELLTADEKSLLTKDFCNDFRIFSNQTKFDEVQPYITRHIKYMLNRSNSPYSSISYQTFRYVACEYTNFITSWCQDVLIENYCLDQKDVLNKLTQLFLQKCNYISLFYKQTKWWQTQDEELRQWRSLIQDRNIIIIDVDPSLGSSAEIYNLLNGYISNKIRKCINNEVDLPDWEETFPRNFCQQFYCELADESMKEEMMKTIGRKAEITTCNIYEVLWKLRRIPLVVEVKTVEEYKNLLYILRLSNYNLRVIVLKQNTAVKCDEIRIDVDNPPELVTNLEHVNEKAQKDILAHHVTIQGRQVMLQALVEKQKIRMSVFSTRNVVQIILGTLKIGNDLCPVPDHFINRTI